MLEVGTKAPAFELTDQNGEMHTLEEHKEKKTYGKVSMGVVRTTYYRNATERCFDANERFLWILT